MKDPFGWDYPAGAENDPRAPYNQPDGSCEHCGEYVEDCQCDEPSEPEDL